MFRLLLLGAALSVAAAALSAHYAKPAGYQYELMPLAAGSGSYGLIWDVPGGAAEGQCYFRHNGGFRRVNPNTTPPGVKEIAEDALFEMPENYPGDPPFLFFDWAAIDPANPDTVFASFSESAPHASAIGVFTRTGLDSATEGIWQSYADYTPINSTAAGPEDIAIFRMQFIPDLPTVPEALRGMLIAGGANTKPGLGVSPIKIWAVNTDPLSADFLHLTELATIIESSAGGIITADPYGNVYAVVGFLPPAHVVRYSAEDLLDALAGNPLPTSAAQTVIDPSEGLNTISAMAVREEQGALFMYFAESDSGSIFHRDLATGQTRLWTQGYGIVDGPFFGGANSLAFENLTDDFRPKGGGETRLAVSFTLGSLYAWPGWGNYATEWHLFTPEAVDVTPAVVSVASSPGQITRGIPFDFLFTIDPGFEIALEVELTTGAGVLSGFKVQIGLATGLPFTGLIYDSELTESENISLTFTKVGTDTSVIVNLTVAAEPDDNGNGGGNGDDDNGSSNSSSGCAAGGGQAPWLLLWIVAAALLTRRRGFHAGRCVSAR